MTHIPYLQFNFDAQACYDCIIPEIAMIISKKHGVQETLQASRYFIKLGEKVTTKSYQNTSNVTLFGKGQGSGCSPHIWTMISSELFELYTTEGIGSQLKSPYGELHSSVLITAYVDDINTHHSYTNQYTIVSVIQQATKSAQKWSNILHVSGGKLSNTKCNYYMHPGPHINP
jgi:hypothetical protein